ncbi:restriction endonuclease subunit S [Rothia sp. HMSC069C03]|uniref:restriction endonuclease subunit S n=1 Tax=Rothia sp. HMSC069C03 TaxID=1739283 RepID=UPI0018F88BF0|nr:restriction endonuclease subunit S [Rothia sp. HMSC069C03]
MADVMNYIDRLVAELCPDGVDFYPIEELFTTRNGYTPSKSNSSYWENGTVPWFRMEDIRENGGVLSEAMQSVHESALKKGGMFPAGSIIVATSATIGEHALINVDFLCNQRFTVLTPKEEFKSLLLPKFLYYYSFVLDRWCLSNTTQSSFASVDMKRFKKFEFPVPPLEIQEALVEILDKFTNLEAELEAELEARTLQYEYYRDSLFEALDCPRVPLGSLGTFVRGNGLQKKDLQESGNPVIHYGQVFTRYGLHEDKTLSYANDEVYNKLRKAEKGNLVIATTSENDEDVCKALAWLGETPAGISGDAYIYRHEMNPKYVSYFFTTHDFHRQKLRHITGTKVRRVSGKNLETIEIPLPSLEEQQRIVDILDRFDALTSSLSEGLPAELAARRSQYEYYRDQLLTFPRKGDNQ